MVNGLLKYTIENSNDTNLRKVTTSVTVSDVHSVVNTNTEPMHIYCVKQLAMSQIHAIGRVIPGKTVAGSVDDAIVMCSQMLLYSNKKPGSGNRCCSKGEKKRN